MGAARVELTRLTVAGQRPMQGYSRAKFPPGPSREPTATPARSSWPRFANDLTDSQLIAVSAASNRSEADQGPDEWKPPLRSYWCVDGRAWTDVKYDYGLTVTEGEKSSLEEMLDTCLVGG